MSILYQKIKSEIEDCFELMPRIFKDHRGISVKTFNEDLYKEIGITHKFAEDLMVTSHKGVLRGLHFQKPSYEQAKLIWCISGSIFDVAVDIRKNSSTYGQFVYFNIDSRKRNLVYIPAGFAHGYQVMEDNTTVYYKMSSVYSPEHEGGLHYSSLNIPWPIEEKIVSDKDIKMPKFNEFISVF